MKKIICLLSLLSVMSLSGCVQTTYTKTIAVKKDANGNILETLETETVTQPGQGWPIKMKHFKEVQN